MRYIAILDIYYDDFDGDGCLAFEPPRVLERLRAFFPEFAVDVEDPLVVRAERTAASGRRLGHAENRVTDSDFRLAAREGPANRVVIPNPSGNPLVCLVMKHMIKFDFDDTVPEGIQARVRAFLDSISLLPAEFHEYPDGEVFGGAAPN